MNEAQILATYKAILTTTHQMLAAVEKNEWDTVNRLGQQCKQLTDTLTAHPIRQVLSKEAQKEKVALIQQIFACDAKIRAITEPGITRLHYFLSRVHKAIE